MTSREGFVALLTVGATAGAASTAVATRLAPSAPRVHGWVFGGLVLALDVLTVFSPDTAWPLGPGLILLALVPPQTRIGVRLGARWRPEPDATPQPPGVRVSR